MILINYQAEFIEKFKELVSIDSYSFQERELADFLKAELVANGLRVIEDNTGEKIGGNTGNIIAELPGNDKLPEIVLSAHLDRVSPADNIEPVISGEYLISKGETILAVDDLVGVVTIILLLNSLQENQNEHGKIKVIFTVAEEQGLQGSRYLDPKYYKEADFALVLDGGGDVGQIITDSPYRAAIKAEITGKAAHAGAEPEAGINAIKVASRAINNLQLGRIDAETTANIALIEGGKALNIVPEKAVFSGEVRSQNLTKLKNVLNNIEKVLNEAATYYNGQANLEIRRLYNGYHIEHNNEFLNNLKISAEKIGLSFKTSKSGGGSDANHFNENGLLAFNLGCGIEAAHTKNEKIKLKNIVLIADFVKEIIFQ